MEDIVYFILVFIFFVLPILGRIAEAFKGDANQNKKRPSRDDIREYLERMRSSGQKQGQQGQYQYQATKPSITSTFDEDEEGGSSPPIWKSENKFNNIEKSVENDIYRHVEKHLQIKIEEEKPKASVPGGNLHNLIMANKEFSDIKKAIILTEIFSQPKGLKE